MIAGSRKNRAEVSVPAEENRRRKEAEAAWKEQQRLLIDQFEDQALEGKQSMKN